MKDILVKCTRCRHQCMESEWIDIPHPKIKSMTEATCPKCGCKSYYDMRPQVAWCWASGLIEIGDQAPADNEDGSGAIVIATGPKSELEYALQILARHGQGESCGKLLVPGVPEASDRKAAADSLSEWLKWCSQSRTKKRFKDVVFTQERFQ